MRISLSIQLNYFIPKIPYTKSQVLNFRELPNCSNIWKFSEGQFSIWQIPWGSLAEKFSPFKFSSAALDPKKKFLPFVAGKSPKLTVYWQMLSVRESRQFLQMDLGILSSWHVQFFRSEIVRKSAMKTPAEGERWMDVRAFFLPPHILRRLNWSFHLAQLDGWAGVSNKTSKFHVFYLHTNSRDESLWHWKWRFQSNQFKINFF